MNKYPWSDSTSSDVKKVLFESGIRTFNEDFDSMEQYREDDSITRFNSIVKIPGVAAKKADENTTLFPTVIAGNQLKISSGVGFTNNGAMIEVQYDISISDIKAIPGYQSPSPNTQVYLVLTKQIQEYAKRVHPITGQQFPTRTLIKSDSSIVNFLAITADMTDNNQFNDCVVLGRLTSTDPAAFDTTEATGKRKILRISEQKFLEITGGIMEGNIDMNNKWEILNLPQWGKTYYVKNGSVHNLDFLRLFARTNYNSFGIKSLKFVQSGTLYGIQFGPTTGPKLILIPLSKPPNKIDVVITNMFVSIPENNVLYLDLSDYDLGIELGSGIGVGTEGQLDSLNGQLTITSDVFSRQPITTGNYGTTVGNSLNKYPIAYHYYNAMYNTRYLLFANGLVLNLNQEINENGYDGAYLHTDGSNEMLGDVKITKSNAQVVFKPAGTAQGLESGGLNWVRSADSVTVGSFKRFSAVLPDSDTSIGDYVLVAMNNNATNQMKFIFKVDGRLKIPTAPTEYNDAIRKQELDLKVNKFGDTITGDLVFVDGSTVIVKGQTPTIILYDTAPTSSYQSIDILRKITEHTDASNTKPLTRWMRLSETNTQLPIECTEGDLLFETHDNSGFGSAWFKLRFSDNSFVVNNLVCTKVIANEVVATKVTADEVIATNKVTANEVIATKVNADTINADTINADIVNYANTLQNISHQSTVWGSIDIHQRKRTFHFCLSRFNESDPVIFTNPVTGEDRIYLGSNSADLCRDVTARFNINYHYNSVVQQQQQRLSGIMVRTGVYIGARDVRPVDVSYATLSASDCHDYQIFGSTPASVRAFVNGSGHIQSFIIDSPGWGYTADNMFVSINDGVDYNRFPDGLCKFDDHGRLQSISKYQDRVLEITPGNYYPVRFYTNSFTYDLIPEVQAVDHPTAPASIRISLNTPNLADTTGAWSAEIEIDEQYLDYNSH